jgi:rRNA maturation RNase YbeY
MKEPSFPFELEHLIEFFEEDIEYSLPNEDDVNIWLKETLVAEKKELDTISYIFCSDGYLLTINNTYLKHDDFTDIITFPYNRDPIEGDVFISIDRVKENAKTFQVNEIDEVHRLLVHGLLHLIGYDDKTPTDKEKMTELENFYLSKRSFHSI